jgi:hypothetical protein
VTKHVFAAFVFDEAEAAIRFPEFDSALMHTVGFLYLIPAFCARRVATGPHTFDLNLLTPAPHFSGCPVHPWRPEHAERGSMARVRPRRRSRARPK